MKSPMLPAADHQAAVRRVLALGRSGDPAVLATKLRLFGYAIAGRGKDER